jgi:hypothetical protein
MTPIKWFVTFTSAALVSCSNTTRTSMSNYPLILHVESLHPSPVDEVNSLRLIPDGNALSLAGMTAGPDGIHDVSIRTLETDPLGIPRPLAKLSSPFGIPFWDAASTPKGFATVWTIPGSAISSLGYQVPGRAEITLTGHYPSGVFQNPRFVRSDSGLAITACAMQPLGEAIVLFQDGLESGDAQYRLLPAVGQGTVLDGLLIHNGSRYLLLVKLAAPALGASSRMDLRGESAPRGVLRCMWLDSEFQAVDSAFSPFGDSAVFEFDADASDGHIYLLATTTRGFVVASAVIREMAWQWIVTEVATKIEGTLFAPAVSAHGKSATVVFLNAGESGSREILRGKILIQEQ